MADRRCIKKKGSPCSSYLILYIHASEFFRFFFLSFFTCDIMMSRVARVPKSIQIKFYLEILIGVLK